MQIKYEQPDGLSASEKPPPAAQVLNKIQAFFVA
jgi:hypothetical protein